MKILITGANGQLASYLAEVFPKNDLSLATKEKLDVRNKIEVLSQVAAFKPDIIFHLASLTRGDDCAKEPAKAFAINVEGTRNVVESCKKNDIPLLFLSTNEVFDGKKKTPYTERDIPNPITVVGKTKYDAEKIIRENLNQYFIIRTSWLYGKWSKNFLSTVLDAAKQDKKINLVTDEISSPTYSLDLASAIKNLALRKKYGIYNLNNTGHASRLDFAKKAFDICGIRDTEIFPIKLADYKRESKPPLYTPLDNNKAKRLGIKLPKWEEALKRFLVSYKI